MKSIAFDVEIPVEEQAKRKRLGYGTKVAKSFFRSMKDIAIMIDELSAATRYSQIYLQERFEDALEDTGDCYEAWEEVRDISLEYDW